MKTMIKSIVVAVVLAQTGSYISAVGPDDDATMFPALDEFFDDFGRLTGQADATVQKEQGNVTQDTELLFKTIRAENKKIEQAAMRGMQALMRETADMSKGLDEAYQSLRQSQECLRKSIGTIGSTIEASKKTRQVAVEEFDNKEKTKEFPNGKWGLKIILPGYSEENLTVNINKDDATKKTLEVIAKKVMPQKTDGKKQTVRVSQAYSSQVMVAKGSERKQERITCVNGALTIMRDLPSFIDDTSYVMKFADEILTIEFGRKTESAVTTLKFSK